MKEHWPQRPEISYQKLTMGDLNLKIRIDKVGNKDILQNNMLFFTTWSNETTVIDTAITTLTSTFGATCLL